MIPAFGACLNTMLIKPLKKSIYQILKTSLWTKPRVRRGHKYVTIFIDMDTKRVIFVTTGKGSDVLKEFCLFLDSKGVSRSQIKEFCSDMSPAFISGIENNFPKAYNKIAKFQLLNMDKQLLYNV